MTQVAVVGGDPAALTTALALARADVEVLVVDPGQTGSAPWRGVLSWSAVPVLESVGVLADTVAAGHVNQVRGLRVLRTGEHLELNLSVLENVVPHPYDLHIGGGALRGILRDHLARHPNVELLDAEVVSLRAAEGSVDIELQVAGEQRLQRVSWLVAADGTNSAIRRLLGLGFPGTTWQERVVVARLEHDLGGLGYAGTTLQVDPQFGALVQHLGGTSWRYTYLEPMFLPEHEVLSRLETLLRGVAPDAEPGVRSWWSGRMHERAVENYQVGRVLLMGEAAHCTSLLSNGGTSSSFADSVLLVEALVTALQNPGSTTALDAYAELRRRDFLDRVVPASVDRTHLITQISDPTRLDTELEQYRSASGDAAAQRELLLFGRTWATESATNNR